MLADVADASMDALRGLAAALRTGICLPSMVADYDKR